MAKKKNQSLRPKCDYFQRKKANDRQGWEKQMLEQLKTPEESTEEGRIEKRKGIPDNAKRKNRSKQTSTTRRSNRK